MNELSNTTKTLPQTIEEKTAFVLFGSDALNAYRKKLKAIQSKYGISSEQYKQIQLEAQETAENLLLFSADIGKEMQRIEKAKGGASFHEATRDVNVKSKSETIHNMGFTDRQARDFQTLAKHPDSVQRAIRDARKEDRIVTRQDVFHDIAATEYPSRRQKEEQELREAKKRVGNFENSKVVAIGEAKQNKDDNKLIFEEFNETVHKATMAVLHMAIKLDEKTVTKAIKATSNEELKEVLNDLQEDYKTILKVQKKIVEVIDEKQP